MNSLGSRYDALSHQLVSDGLPRLVVYPMESCGWQGRTLDVGGPCVEVSGWIETSLLLVAAAVV